MPNAARARPKPANLRPDHNGTQRAQFESNKKKIYASQRVCGICEQAVDFSLKFPHPLSPCIDHIIPVSKPGIRLTSAIYSLLQPPKTYRKNQ